MNRSFLVRIVALIVFFAILGYLLTHNANAVGLGNCDTGFLHKDESAPFGWTRLDGDMKINKIIVKAGSQNQGDACFEFDQAPTNDGCYEVFGIGTSTVTVTKVGDGRDCKDISHVEFYGVEPSPSPSPSPSPDPSSSPSPSPSPSPEVSPSPSPSPSVSPSPSPSAEPTPTPTPTPTPSVEKQVENLQEELKQTYGNVPSIGFK